ncbi:hypothetical protein BP6252_13932 [Coleophoma cylindrospora]|uniref:WW domain-containing protein n=1 Tax=Coleophoma cylindrospora TaxID=1849047 RepID=A0A3D8Q6I2_9HELO|nr:hypothetical protein BP6252_13932 [Coleophoma cylindrospora]
MSLTPFLCSNCPDPEGVSKAKQTSFADLRQAAENGCSLCKVVLEGIFAHLPSWRDEVEQLCGKSGSDVRWLQRTIQNGVIAPLVVEVVIWKAKEGAESEWWDCQREAEAIEFFVEEGRPSPDARLIYMRSVPPRSDSDRCIETMQGWMKNCMENHTLCKPRTGKRSTYVDAQGSLPDGWECAETDSGELCYIDRNKKIATLDRPVKSLRGKARRLIDVGVQPLFEDVKLIDTSEDEPVDSYATLSYCWGTETLWTTTNETLSSHKTQIPWQKLATTIQDAIRLTRILGLKYIWIDSLCIIQDDASDWAAESAVMGDIYEFSTVTIAATHAAQGSDGCFSERYRRSYGSPFTPRSITSTELVYTDAQGVAWPICSRRQLSHSFTNHSKDEIEKQDLALLTRAWVFQERLLASRTLHLTNSEVVWECKQGMVCECGGLRKDADAFDDINLKARFDILVQFTTRETGVYPQFVSQMWEILVQSYMKKNLTFSSDRMIALSGITKKFQAATKWTYIAGIWQEELPGALLWRFRSDKKFRRPVEYIAPSWSWASLEGGYPEWIFEKTAGRDYSPGVQVIEVKCEPKNDDEFGQLSSASLEIFGNVIPIAFECRLEPRYDDLDAAEVELPKSTRQMLMQYGGVDLGGRTTIGHLADLLTGSSSHDEYAKMQEEEQKDTLYIDGGQSVRLEKHLSRSRIWWLDKEEYDILGCPRNLYLLLVEVEGRFGQASCDGCNTYIYGTRYKCQDCPDWDYCSACIDDADVVHEHSRDRFDRIEAPVDEPLIPVEQRALLLIESKEEGTYERRGIFSRCSSREGHKRLPKGEWKTITIV